MKGLTALLEKSWDLEGIGEGKLEEGAGEELDDTYSRQLKELPVDENDGVALEKPKALGEKSERNLPGAGSNLNLRFEANIGGVYGVSASDKVDADDWGGEADLVGIAQPSRPSRPSRPFKTQIDQLCSG